MLAVFTLHSSLRSLGQSRDIFLFEDDIAGLLCLVDTKKQHFTNDLIPLAQNIWLNPVLRDFKSISEAREILLGTQRNWSMFPGREYGRSKLIQKQLPFVSNKPISFPEKPKNSPLGSWTLLDKNKILFSSACSSRVSHGIYNFIEDKNGPPSRAYLKLWEFFTKEGVIPKSDSSCIDLGASPGGWSWVLSGLSKRVHAVDKSPIEKSLGLNRKIRFHQADVLKIKRLDDIDRSINWLFCDAAIHPEKLIPHLQKLVINHPQLSFVCTIKFAGLNRYHWLKTALNTPYSSICHLSHNKHECTWYRIMPNSFTRI